MLYGSSLAAYKASKAREKTVREFFYGVLFGALTIYCYHHFDAPGILGYLNDATSSAVKSTSGYGGKSNKPAQ